MISTRVIPCLLLKGQGLVKTIRFKEEKYVGDPINTVRIFNEKEVDELILLDVMASVENQPPRVGFIHEIVSESFMPVCYGGGVTSLREMEGLFRAGIEKISMNTSALERPDLVHQGAKAFGSQSIVVAMDVKKDKSGRYSVFARRGQVDRRTDPAEHARRMADLGAGEVLVNSIDRDGTGEGYDLELLRRIGGAVTVPVVVCGGAGRLAHFKEAIQAGAAAVAAGSLFVFVGKHRAVLITYPSQRELKEL